MKTAECILIEILNKHEVYNDFEQGYSTIDDDGAKEPLIEAMHIYAQQFIDLAVKVCDSHGEFTVGGYVNDLKKEIK